MVPSPPGGRERPHERPVSDSRQEDGAMHDAVVHADDDSILGLIEGHNEPFLHFATVQTVLATVSRVVGLCAGAPGLEETTKRLNGHHKAVIVAAK